MKSERIIEAELFSAGKPVTVTDLSEISGLDARTIRGALDKLTRRIQRFGQSDRDIQDGTKVLDAGQEGLQGHGIQTG